MKVLLLPSLRPVTEICHEMKCDAMVYLSRCVVLYEEIYFFLSLGRYSYKEMKVMSIRTRTRTRTRTRMRMRMRTRMRASGSRHAPRKLRRLQRRVICISWFFRILHVYMSIGSTWAIYLSEKVISFHFIYLLPSVLTRTLMDLNFAGEGFSTRLKTRLDTGHEIALRSYCTRYTQNPKPTTKCMSPTTSYLPPPTINTY